tara:strand:+ start:312 stop:494 length:183 start_codon:yes stop_codon:yes gene_type:complete
MEEIVNLIATDSSAADISDRMKDVLFTKAAGKIDAQKANVALSMFDTSTPETVENTEDQE